VQGTCTSRCGSSEGADRCGGSLCLAVDAADAKTSRREAAVQAGGTSQALEAVAVGRSRSCAEAGPPSQREADTQAIDLR